MTVQISRLRVSIPATVGGTVQVSRIRAVSAGLPAKVQVSRLRAVATATVSVTQTIDPYDLVVLPGSGWVQTSGPTTAPGGKAPAGPNGYVLRYTGPGEAVITVLPHTLFTDAALTRPLHLTA